MYIKIKRVPERPAIRPCRFILHVVNIPRMIQTADDAGQPEQYRVKLRSLLKVLKATKAKKDLSTYAEARKNFKTHLKNLVQHVCTL